MIEPKDPIGISDLGDLRENYKRDKPERDRRKLADAVEGQQHGGERRGEQQDQRRATACGRWFVSCAAAGTADAGSEK